MEFRYVICDVFTDRPLAGNQLAVFTDARLVPENLLQPIAREMNLSETVFVYPAAKGGHARIRIFTPFNELPFAGHPVLGSAFVLAAPLQLPTIVLETGIVTVSLTLPMPLAVNPEAPPVCVAVKVTPVNVDGKLSLITAPVTLLGPKFVTVIM